MKAASSGSRPPTKRLKISNILEQDENEQVAAARARPSPAIDRLPWELFDRICEYGSEFGRDLSFGGTLLLVCRRWRRAALANPHLWRFVKVLLPEGVEHRGRKRLDELASRAKACTIAVLVTEGDRQVSPAQREAAAAVLVPLFCRAHDVHLCGLYVAACWSRLPPNSMPRVRKLTLNFVSFDSWAGLLDLLACCSRLEALTAWGFYIGEDEPAPDRVVDLDALESLTFGDIQRLDPGFFQGQVTWSEFSACLNARPKEVSLTADIAEFESNSALWPQDDNLSEVRKLTLISTTRAACGAFVFDLISSRTMSKLEDLTLRNLQLTVAVGTGAGRGWHVHSSLQGVFLSYCESPGLEDLVRFFGTAAWSSLERFPISAQRINIKLTNCALTTQQLADKLRELGPRMDAVLYADDSSPSHMDNA